MRNATGFAVFERVGERLLVKVARGLARADRRDARWVRGGRRHDRHHLVAGLRDRDLRGIDDRERGVHLHPVDRADERVGAGLGDVHDERVVRPGQVLRVSIDGERRSHGLAVLGHDLRGERRGGVDQEQSVRVGETDRKALSLADRKDAVRCEAHEHATRAVRIPRARRCAPRCGRVGGRDGRCAVVAAARREDDARADSARGDEEGPPGEGGHGPNLSSRP